MITENVEIPKTTCPLVGGAVSEKELEIIVNLLKIHVPNCDVLAYGSRFKNTHRKTSDLDLAVVAEKRLSFSALTNLVYDFMESDLPFSVDILDYNAVPEHFRENIDRGNAVIYRGGNHYANT
ncbi:MAG: nucleotidyltransferase domain-containing protein [Defluviitaleaceae bacterium]|nr:nucleotidyltransferase domain-containing protein [Defluviitaleaceae bacterium]